MLAGWEHSETSSIRSSPRSSSNTRLPVWTRYRCKSADACLSPHQELLSGAKERYLRRTLPRRRIRLRVPPPENPAVFPWSVQYKLFPSWVPDRIVPCCEDRPFATTRDVSCTLSSPCWYISSTRGRAAPTPSLSLRELPMRHAQVSYASRGSGHKEIPHQVKKDGCCKAKRINAVQNSAVSFDHSSEILYSNVALDRAHHQSASEPEECNCK